MTEANTNPVPEPGPPIDPLRKLKIALSMAALILGLSTIVMTVANGGGIAARGVLLGVVLALLAGGRLFLIFKAGM